MKVSIFLTLILSLSLATAQAQAPATQPYSVANTLANQFNSMKNRSSNYQENQQDYKVVRLATLNNFWKSVQDSLQAKERALVQARKGVDQELIQARETIQTQNAQLQSLQEENAEKERAVQQSADDVANLSVLGLHMNKQTYVILSWAIIISLLVGLGVLFYLYKSSKRITDEKRRAFEEIDQEFKEHKQVARERELKVKRELQTEMNRIEELHQEIALLRKQTHM